MQPAVNATKPPYEGQAITIAGKEWIVPPLNFARLKKLEEDLKLLGDLATVKNMAFPTLQVRDAMTRIVHTAMTRNYPDLTTDEVEEMLDFSILMRLIEIVFGVSGLSKERAGDAPGETRTGG